MDLLDGGHFGLLRVEFLGEGGRTFFELFKEAGSDGEKVAAGKFGDFVFVAEGGAHNLGGVSKFFIVVVDLGDGDNAGVVMGGVRGYSFAFLVPVEDAADERGDEGGFGFCAGNGLGEAEKEGHIAMDPFFLKFLGGDDPFPGGGEFDEDPFAVDAGGFIEGDEVAGFGNAAVDVKGEAGVHFGRNSTGDDFEDFKAKVDEDLI